MISSLGLTDIYETPSRGTIFSDWHRGKGPLAAAGDRKPLHDERTQGGLSNRKRSQQFQQCFHSNLTLSSRWQTARQHLTILCTLLPLAGPRLADRGVASCHPQEQESAHRLESRVCYSGRRGNMLSSLRLGSKMPASWELLSTRPSSEGQKIRELRLCDGKFQ